MAAFDWASTPVGPVESWPASLRFAVRTVLVSRFPMVLTWGPDFLQFYNDAYAPLIGAKHPAIGEDIRLTLAEGWDALGPPIEHAMQTLEASWLPGPAPPARARRLPRGDLLHRLPRPGLRRRRPGGRDARGLHRGDRRDPRRAPAAAAARPRHRRRPPRRRAGDRGGDVRALWRATPSTCPYAAVYLSVPGDAAVPPRRRGGLRPRRCCRPRPIPTAPSCSARPTGWR